MKIHMHSTVFSPSVGGVETVGHLLAEAWGQLGSEVRVSTETLGEVGAAPEVAYPIHRRPSFRDLWKLTRWADVVFHNHPSTRVAWAPILARKPWFGTVHTWMPFYVDRSGQDIRRKLLQRCRFLAVSRAIAAHLPRTEVPVAPNPYRAQHFHRVGSGPRSVTLLFVGRLVSDKGCDVLLAALGHLRKLKLFPNLEIVGEGPERLALEGMVRSLELSDQVTFSGTLSSEGVAKAFARSRMTVVPSTWKEPFGLVALEALAVGSYPVVSDTGGLPEACGGLGTTFPAGDAIALAEALQELLSGEMPENYMAAHQSEVARHLARHEPLAVAANYLEHFSQP